MFKFFASLVLVAAVPCVADAEVPAIFKDPARVVFDLPDTVECRDVTPAVFAKTHPALKVIEARIRISARFLEGDESEIVDFLYIVASPNRNMHFQDYLPNTSLESAVVDDQIAITDTTENAKGGQIGAQIGYQGVGGGLSITKSSKKTLSSNYREIAARALVVASGTTDHEHGIFFKLKPSRAASLEGAKVFTFLATVPRSWRAGWCTISCAARARSNNYFSRSGVVSAGVAQSEVGLYLMGDVEANSLAEELGAVQERHADILAQQLAKGSLLETMYESASTGKTASLCGIFKLSPSAWASAPGQKDLEIAERALINVEERLQRLSE